MPADYHTHNQRCRHAEGRVADYAAVARDKGLSGFGASDHNPMPQPFDDWRMLLPELDDYVAEVRAAAAAFAPFPVRLGLEVDYLSGGERWIEELSRLHPWDYLIGAVHYISPGWDVDNPKHISRFDSLGVEAVWDLYWKQYVASVRSGFFDIHAHPDLPKKFGHVPGGDLRRYYEPAITALAESGAAMELNTAGLRKPIGKIYPAREFVNLAFQAGIPIVISSDAHAPGEVGAGFDVACAVAWEAGYRETALFEGRRRTSEPLQFPPPPVETDADLHPASR